MKICSLCGTTYDGRVDFCFKDGTPLEAAPEDAVREASPFDEDLPDVGPPSAPVGGTDLPEPRNLRFDDVPEPMGLRQGGLLPDVGEDLPEPAFLKPSTPEPEPEPEPAPAPTPSPSPPLAPLSESPTIPVPLDQAQPFFDADDEPQAPPPGTGFAESGSESEALTEQDEPSFAEAASTEPVAQPDGASAALDAPTPEEPPEDLEASMDASPTPDEPAGDLDDDVSFEGTPAWADTPEEPQEEKKGPPMGLIFGGLIALVLVGGGGFLLTRGGDDEPAKETVEAPAPPKAKAEEPPKPPAPEPEPQPEPQPEDAVADAEIGAEDAAADAEIEPEPAGKAPAAATNPPRAKSQPKRQPEATASSDDPWGATTAPVAANARLKVTSEPVGARIYIDGKDVGTSPLEYAVSTGSHKIRAEMDGYDAAEILSKVDGAAGQAHVQLRKKPQAQPAVAMVSLFGPGGAQVFVNGKSLGVLPIDTQMAPGSYQFKVMTPDGTAYTVNGSVQAGQQNRLPLLPP